MIIKKIGSCSFLIFLSLTIFAQNTRLKNSNTIGWYNTFATFKIAKKISIHTEYQWRRADVITNWQQSLLRIGINYNQNAKIQYRLGYGWIETFAYGDVPINGFGKTFTEHRIFEAITLADNKIGILDPTHRFMLEQRFVGRYSNAAATKENEYVFTNRLRYMFRLNIPLKGKSIVANTPYVSMYDEIFVGFGKNVNENIFDQNRVGLLVGYNFNKKAKLEAGYLSQIVQLGREIGGSNLFQYNNGLIINAVFNIDLTGK